jgi:nucleoside-diphosphate-sugar epimerase
MSIILITGGAGFLGCNLTEYLLKKENPSKIIIIDNYITSNPINIYNISKKYPNKIDILKLDICNHSFIKRIQELYETIHQIYHLASLASPKAYKTYPISTLDVGYLGTRNVLDLCVYYDKKNIEPCKFLYTSTSEVYGDALQHPQTELYYGNVNTCGERSCYDESKRIAETLVYEYTNHYNIETRIVRIFNTYGPYMNLDDGRIVTEIIKAMLYNTTLQIYGNGLQTRSLNFVIDTINMMYNVMHSDYTQPVNIGSEEEISINTLVNILQKVYTSYYGNQPSFQICYTSIDKDDPKVRKPCLKLYNTLFNKDNNNHNNTSLEEGLLKTLEYFISGI